MDGIDFVQNHCRICASNSSDVRNMFEVIYKEKRLFDILEECLQRKLDTSEHFPNSICSECCADLIKMHKFIANYEESEKRFKDRFNAINEITIKTEAMCFIECQEQNPEIIFESKHQIFIESLGDAATIEEPTINMLEVKEELDFDYESEVAKLPESDNQTINGSHFETQDLNEAYHYYFWPGNEAEVCVRRGGRILVKRDMGHTKRGTGPYKCGQCWQRFSTPRHLKLHENLHTGKKLFECFFCEEKLRRSDYRVKHIRQMHPEVSFECVVCKMPFELHYDLCRHVLKNHTPGVKPKARCARAANELKSTEIFKCGMCSLQFSSRKLLKLHATVHTTSRGNDSNETVKICEQAKESKTTERYKCSMCLQQFSTQRHLKLHENLHTGEKLFECFFCEEKLRRSDYRVKHIRQMHPEVIFECFVCKMPFELHYDLSRHMRRNRHHDLAKNAGNEIQKASILKDKSHKPYECPEEGCGKAFSEKYKLVDHQLCHSNERPFECTQQHCSKAFKRKYELQCHLKIHEGKREHFCDICGKGFVTRRNLRSHRASHSQESEYSCKLCPKAFRRIKSLRVHMERHAGKFYECKYCDMKLTSRRGKDKHERNIHGTRKTFECFACKKVFDEHSDLYRHMGTHSSNRLIFECPAPACTKCFWTEHQFFIHKRRKHATDLIFDCEYCTQSFKSKTEQKSHVRFMHKDELMEYSCAECSATFNLQSLLKSHIYHTHTREPENLLCPECGKTFRTSNILKLHLKSHRTDRPFACDRCPSQFKNRFQLKSHMSMHSSERNYVCDVVVSSSGDGDGRVCGKAFVRQDSLRSHKLTHSDERPFACTKCPIKCRTNYKLQVHMRTHTGERPHKCDHCDRAFTQKGDLTKHLLIHLGPTPHKCAECEMSFRLETELRKHSYSHFKPPEN